METNITGPEFPVSENLNEELRGLENVSSFIEENIKKEPETLLHQCSMCGIRMEIPRPKRERYKVICAYPECGHEDNIGF